MGDDREKELLFTARPPPGPEGSDVYNASTVATQAPADLLDLVRAAEDEAKLGASDGKMPTSATKFHVGKVVASKEEFIDVGDEAIDAPPSLPPNRAATPAKTFTPARHFAPAAAAAAALITPSEPEPEPESSRPSRITAAPARPSEPRRAPDPRPTTSKLPPIAGIVLVFALSIAAIALLTR